MSMFRSAFFVESTLTQQFYIHVSIIVLRWAKRYATIIKLVCCVMMQFWVCTCIFLQVTINLDGGETLVDGMTTFLSGKLSPNTVYTYTILAINGAGDGEGSPPMMFRTNFGGTL